MSRNDEMTKKIDDSVSCKIMRSRIEQGLSRKQLARRINVTHQQLHKYEMGMNRITIGRLVLIASALNKPLLYFFDNLETEENARPQHSRMAIEVSRNFMKIKSAANRDAVNTLIRTLAGNL